MSVRSDGLRDKRPAYFQIYKADFLRFDAVPARQRAFAIAAYNAIAFHMNGETEVAFPSYARIAKLTGMSRPLAIRSVEALVGAGLLVKQQRWSEKDNRNTSNLYAFQSLVTERNQLSEISTEHNHTSDGASLALVTERDSNEIKDEQDKTKEEMWQQLALLGIPDRPSYIRLIGRAPYDDPAATLEFARRKLAEKRKA